MGVEFLFIALPVVAVLCWAAYVLFRGDTVGTARGLQQGEHTVPGAPVMAVVKRHMDGNRPVDVELQLWTLGIAKVFRLEPGEAQALSQALQRAVAEVRGSE